MAPVTSPPPPPTAAAEGDEEEEEEEEENVAYHPPAPSSELFDITTTVDPSYIISLIRKLIPHGGRTEHDSCSVNNHSASIQGSETFCEERITGSVSHHQGCNGMDNKSGVKQTVVDCDRSPRQKLTDEHREMGSHQFVDSNNTPDIFAGVNEMNPEFELREINEGFHDASEKPGVSSPEDPWEECGCILWDLAANKTHAEFMVENLLLEVLLASLIVSKSVRVTEICLGILGNLACHEVPRNAITSTNALIGAIVNQLFLDDSLCLAGTCWLLTLGLQGGPSVTWAEELLRENVLCRILWIAGNTLNSQLLEKCLELLLTIIESQQVAPILLPPLMNMNLLSLLHNLLASEIGNVTDGRGPDRCSVLDSILCVIESLSITNNYSQVVSSDIELFQLIHCVIKLPDKVEVAGSCVTAVVLIANILTDNPNLVSDFSQDLSFLRGLLDILPFVSNDSQARCALWSVMARVLALVEENAMSKLDLQQDASVLVEKLELIEEDFDDHREEDCLEDHMSFGETTNANTASLRRIANILNSWVIARGDIFEKDTTGGEGTNVDGRLQRLLNCFHKYAN